MKLGPKIKSKGNCEIGVKRFYTPFELEKQCPVCDTTMTALGDDYISYPILNEPVDIHWYCCHEDTVFEESDEHEGTSQIVLKMTMQEVIDG